MGRMDKRAEIRALRTYLTRENLKWPAALAPVDPAEWPTMKSDSASRMVMLYRSSEFVCQVFEEPRHPSIVARLSVNRTTIDDDGGWMQGITWDHLQRLKREAGYGGLDAVEVYPEDGKVVNVANMRHLWVLAEPLVFKWGEK